uniref:DUF4283 domain-containing protein n=1 Tax=Tanacetum cinerariifolium TaxID=118510 RepID=A0A6L2LZ26_TANCI|nr:hypothetical protein [Tanacetum cinerariifolium]
MSSEGLSHKPFVPPDVSVSTRSHSDFSPLEDNHGKRPNSCVAHVDEVLNKVLDRIAFDKSISKQMVFKKGVCDSGKVYGSKSNIPSYYSIDGNDGSFISKLCAPSVIVVKDCNRVREDKESEHGKDESIRKSNKDGLDGMNVDSDFVFRDLKRNKGIRNRPHVTLTKNGVKSNRSLNIESFAKKMKKEVEDRELQMKFEPQYVFVQENVEPSIIPIWVCIYGISLEVCNGTGICKIMSGVGKPMLMEKLTREMCLKKDDKLDFGRVLVEVRARTEKDVVDKVLKESLKVDKDSYVKVGGDNNDNDCFVEVRKKNKYVSVKSGLKYNGKEKGNGVGSSRANFVPDLKKFVKPHDDREIDDEYKNVVWPKLKYEVEDVMKSDLYPSKSIMSNWSLASFDLFYNNYSKYVIEPYLEDDDVESDDEADSIGSPSSTTVDQDAPSLSKSHTTAETQSSIIPQDVEEDNLDIEVAHMGNDPLFGVPIPKVTFAQSSSTISPHQIMQPDHQIPQHNNK